MTTRTTKRHSAEQEMIMKNLIEMCQKRRALSDQLRYPYMRNAQADLRNAIESLDVQIMMACRSLEISEAQAYRMAIPGVCHSCM